MEFKFSIPDGDQAFELFCLRLLRHYWRDSDPQLLGRRGQKQGGVDVIDERGIEPLRAAQCKFRKPGSLLTEDDVAAEVEDAKQFSPTIGRYYILTTSERSTPVQQAVVRLNQAHRKAGLFTITLLTWDRIEEILRATPGLWEESIDPPAKRAIAPIEGKLDVIAQRIERFAAQTVADEYDAALESARKFLEEHRRGEARGVLNRLRANRWDSLTERQRFLTLTYLAQLEYAVGNWTESGRLFLSAKGHQPEDERARINEALGHELLEDRPTAERLARQLAEAFPKSSRPWALICRTAPDDTTVEKLESQLPTHAAADEEVHVALAMRSMRQRNWATAERFAQRAVQGKAEWAAPWLTLAQAKLQIELDASRRPASGIPITKSPGRLQDLLPLLDRAVTLAEAENDYLSVLSHIARAQARHAMGDLSGADKDYAAAFAAKPHDPTVVFYYGRYLFQTERIDAAIPILRSAAALDAGPDARFVLAISLLAKDPEGNKREWLALATDVAASGLSSYRLDAIDLALHGLLGGDDIPSAAELIEGLAAKGLPSIVVETFQTRVELARGNREPATKLAATARSRITDDTDLKTVRFVADAHMRLGDYVNALPLWIRIEQQSRSIADAWQLVDAAERIGRYDVLRPVCRAWREAGVLDDRLLDAELTAVENFAPNEALSLLQQVVAQQPRDRVLRLRLSRLAIQLDRNDLVSRDLHAYPTPDRAGTRQGAAAVHVLHDVKEYASALWYAYELLRHEQDDPIANLGMVFAVFYDTPDVHLVVSQTVGIGCAVCFVEDDTDHEQWMVIEKSVGTAKFSDEYPSDHAIAARLIGLSCGDKFLLGGNEEDGRKATIRAIVNKYVYRARRCMDEWQIRFPNESAIALFRILPGRAAAGEQIPDLTPIIRRTHERKRGIEELLGHYRRTLIPISFVASRSGSGYVDTMTHMATTNDIAIHCCSGNLGDFEAAVGYATAAASIVLDLSAIVTLSLLGLDDQLSSWPTPLIVSPDTLLELREFRDSQQRTPGGWIVPANTDLGIRIVEASEETRQKSRQASEQLLSHLTAAAKSVNCWEVANVPPEKRDQLIEFCGLHGLESMVLAARTGCVLWTDDAAIAEVGRQEFGIRWVWTQAMLARLASEGLINPESYHTASAKLMGFDYESTRFDVATLWQAARIADWKPDSWPLDKAFQALAGLDDPKGVVLIAAQFLHATFSQLIVQPCHSQVATALLNHIGKSPYAEIRVAALRRIVNRSLEGNRPAARTAESCFSKWFSFHGLGS